jgi:cytochrome c
MNMKRFPDSRVLPLWTCLLCTLPAFGAAAQDAEEGRDLARQWCAACHLVEPGGTVASDVAPSFPQIARTGALTPDRLRGWLSDPHPPMPNLSLSRAEIDALIAYLQSLKQP